MSDDEGPCCGNCPYWLNQGHDDERDAEFGVCRRYPPTFMDPDAMRSDNRTYEEGAFPITLDDDLCGEHPDHPARRKIADLARPLIR